MDMSQEGGYGWVVAVNLVIWTGIFLYLLYINGRIDKAEKDQ